MNLLEIIGLIFLIVIVLNAVVGLIAYRISAGNEEDNLPYIHIHRKKIY